MNFYSRPTRQNRDVNDLRASLERCRYHLAASQERQVREIYESLIARYEVKLAECTPVEEPTGFGPE
jgi:hypothetical protein